MKLIRTEAFAHIPQAEPDCTVAFQIFDTECRIWLDPSAGPERRPMELVFVVPPPDGTTFTKAGREGMRVVLKAFEATWAIPEGDLSPLQQRFIDDVVVTVRNCLPYWGRAA